MTENSEDAEFIGTCITRKKNCLKQERL